MAPDYRIHDPKGWCGDPSRGAALGRRSYHADDKSEPVKLYLRRIFLVDGDYDELGTYWGGGKGTLPLWWYADDDCDVDVVIRASDYAEACNKVLLAYPRAEIVAWDADASDVDDDYLRTFTLAYVWEAASFASDEDGESLDRSGDDFAPEARAAMDADCKAFVDANRAELAAVMAEIPASQCGELFYLNRCGHGVGFWSETHKKTSHVKVALERLAAAARKAGEVNVYVGDDGQLYV